MRLSRPFHWMSILAACLPALSLVSAVQAAAAPAAAASAAAGDNAWRQVRQRGELKLGMQHVAQPYAAGAKFRTPEAIEPLLADDLARRLQVRLASIPLGSSGRAAPGAAKTDLALATLAQQDPQRKSSATIATGYVAAPMAIMRTDTSIKSWDQLNGRTVCVTEGGRYVGMPAARYGAIEKIFKAPADALLALRIGGCDAAVHDSALLEELLKMPEWKKFSARLPAGPATPLEFILPSADAAAIASLQRVAKEWQASAYLQQQLTLMARNIAFEVYLDQHVPDCH